MPGNCPHYGRWPQHDFTSLKKLRPQSVTSRIQPGSDVIVCAEMDEQWGYVGAKSRQRWLFYAYDRLRKTVVAHVFGERTMATLGRLMSLLSPFDVVIWMTDGWPLYESRLKGKLHVISKRYTQRIERHNLNLRQHLARLGRKSLSFSKSVELHDKVIGHYWVRQHERDTGGGDGGLTTAERQRLKELERENRELRRSNNILRQASAYFAKAEFDRLWKK